MNVLIDITHPQNVHFFKNIIKELEKKGHRTFITSRNRETAIKLLNEEKLEFYNTGEPGTNLISLAKEWFKRTYFMYKITKKNKIDILLGLPGESTAPIGWITRKPSIAFTNCEDASLNGILANTFAKVICTPKILEKDFGKKHTKINSFNELSYLHPNYFKPDKKILKELGVKEHERYFILRFVSWNAFHDINQQGLDYDYKIKIINLLEKYGKIFISSETELPLELKKYKLTTNPNLIHHVMAFAEMTIGESQTIAIESALLGTSAIRCNSLVGTAHGSGIFKILQNYNLVFSYKNPEEAYQKIEEMLKNKNLKKESKNNQKKLLSENEDPVKKIIEIIEKEGTKSF